MAELEIEAVRDWVETQVSPFRFRHIQGVVRTAQRLADRYRLPVRKAVLAAWFHDCGKELSRGEMKRWLKDTPFHLDREELSMPGLWHPHVGAAIALKKWEVKDKGILEAIRCHTLGSPEMGPLAQVLFVADFIEPGRKFIGAEAARKAASQGLYKAVLLKCSMTVSFLFEKGMKIHPRLLETWNTFLLKTK